MLILLLVLVALGLVTPLPAAAERALGSAEAGPPVSYEEAWGDILRRTVTDEGLVRYDRVQIAGPLRDDFYAVIATIETFDPSTLTTDAEKLAFWMNAYNAKMIERVLDLGTPRSIDGAGFEAVFGKPLRVAGHNLTLDQIEHDILRRQGGNAYAALQPRTLDPRIHVGLNCGAISCPRLRARAFTAANLNAELDRAMHDFVNSPRHFRFEGNTAVLSSLLDWFGSDFDGTGEPAGDYLLGFMDSRRPNADRLRGLFEGRSTAEIKAQPNVRFEYAWDLNAAGG